jgi:hypothetical protein
MPAVSIVLRLSRKGSDSIEKKKSGTEDRLRQSEIESPMAAYLVQSTCELETNSQAM